MTEIVLAAAALGATVMICFTALLAWRGWLDYKRLELAARQPENLGDEADVGVRIELAAVRERLKRLEAIASGVDI